MYRKNERRRAAEESVARYDVYRMSFNFHLTTIVREQVVRVVLNRKVLYHFVIFAVV